MTSSCDRCAECLPRWWKPKQAAVSYNIVVHRMVDHLPLFWKTNSRRFSIKWRNWMGNIMHCLSLLSNYWSVRRVLWAGSLSCWMIKACWRLPKVFSTYYSGFGSCISICTLSVTASSNKTRFRTQWYPMYAHTITEMRVSVPFTSSRLWNYHHCTDWFCSNNSTHGAPFTKRA